MRLEEIDAGPVLYREPVSAPAGEEWLYTAVTFLLKEVRELRKKVKELELRQNV